MSFQGEIKKQPGRPAWNRTKYKYYPFGMLAESSGGDDNRMMFTGHERDAGFGLDYMLARSYSLGLNRFVSPDPFAGSVAPRSPQSWNRYAYVANNPLGWIDPTGLCGIRPDTSNSPFVNDSLAGQEAVSWLGDPKKRHGIYRMGKEAPKKKPTPTITSEATDYESDSGVLDTSPPDTPVEDRPIVIEANAGSVLMQSAIVSSLLARAGITLNQVSSQVARFNWTRAAHIFSAEDGHVGRLTSFLQQARYALLFERVASNVMNHRPDAVRATIITQDAAKVGVQAFTAVTRNGSQVWVTVRNGWIVNAGVNQPGMHR